MTDRQNEILAWSLVWASVAIIIALAWNQWQWERAQRYYR